jgi:hypothetical protein
VAAKAAHAQFQAAEALVVYRPIRSKLPRFCAWLVKPLEFAERCYRSPSARLTAAGATTTE